MLKIREAQFRAFEAAIQRDFEDRMVRSLALPDDSSTRALIRYGVQKCLAFGIQIESDMETFLKLMVVHSPDFENRPGMDWARATLEQSGVSGTAKVRVLSKRMQA